MCDPFYRIETKADDEGVINILKATNITTLCTLTLTNLPGNLIEFQLNTFSLPYSYYSGSIDCCIAHLYYHYNSQRDRYYRYFNPDQCNCLCVSTDDHSYTCLNKHKKSTLMHEPYNASVKIVFISRVPMVGYELNLTYRGKI